MQGKLLHEADGKRTFAVILQKGNEAMRSLEDFAVKERLGASQVTAIGALSSARLAFFDWEPKQYRPIPVEEQVKVASWPAISSIRRRSSAIKGSSSTTRIARPESARRFIGVSRH
jgi:Plants and Prokaryotes Conserved (PCC) domain